MNLYTIYLHPDDYPQHYVVRRLEIIGGEVRPAAIASLCDSLDQARGEVPPGKVFQPRSRFDDPAILEVWL